MRTRPFRQVDVFTAQALRGNPLAVVLEAEDLDPARMQAFAAWTGLSETVFVQAPSPADRAQGADYQVRIFTPRMELPFAGHPTLGAAHAWLRAGGQPQSADHLVQACGVGWVRLRPMGPHWAFAAPALRQTEPDPSTLQAVLQALGLAPTEVLAVQCLDNGPQWWAVLIDSALTLDQLQPDHAHLQRLGLKVGVAALTAKDSPLLRRHNREARAFARAAHTPTADLVVRAFAAASGIPEDPVTGSLNAALGQWLIGQGLLPRRYLALQGTALGRAGEIWVHQDEQGQVWVGGAVSDCIAGEVLL